MDTRMIWTLMVSVAMAFAAAGILVNIFAKKRKGLFGSWVLFFGVVIGTTFILALITAYPWLAILGGGGLVLLFLVAGFFGLVKP